MARLSQTQKIALFLKEEQPTRYTAKRIAEAIITKYPEDYVKKRANDRFSSDDDLIAQVAAEIGAQKDGIKKLSQILVGKINPVLECIFMILTFLSRLKLLKMKRL